MCVDCLFTFVERFSSVGYTLFDYLFAGDVVSVVFLDHYVPNVGLITGLSLSDWVAFVRNHSLI